MEYIFQEKDKYFQTRLKNKIELYAAHNIQILHIKHRNVKSKGIGIYMWYKH